MNKERQILLTEAEAADMLRLSARTLRKARHDGRLRFVLIGRAVRYTVDDLQSYVDSQRQVMPRCLPQKPAARSTNAATRGRVIVPFTDRNAGTQRRDRL